MCRRCGEVGVWNEGVEGPEKQSLKPSQGGDVRACGEPTIISTSAPQNEVGAQWSLEAAVSRG